MIDLRICFINFWYDFDVNDNIFTHILNKKYNIIIDYQNPDIVFTGAQCDKYLGKRVFFCGEPSTIIPIKCDFALMQYNIDLHNVERFPLYLYYIYDFMKKGTIKDFNFFNNDRFFTKEDLITKNKFCNFIASGNCVGEGTFRDKFVKELMKYKKIDCPGTRFNNMEKLYGSSNNGLEASLYKREFIKKYKFTIGFENTSTLNDCNGYTTEKFIEPLVSNTLLLYYGNINIDKEFNTKSFLNYHD